MRFAAVCWMCLLLVACATGHEAQKLPGSEQQCLIRVAASQVTRCSAWVESTIDAHVVTQESSRSPLFDFGSLDLGALQAAVRGARDLVLQIEADNLILDPLLQRRWQREVVEPFREMEERIRKAGIGLLR